MIKLAIVIPAYNRPHALQRLLTSLLDARYPSEVPLVISIDPGGENGRTVLQIAQQFTWPFGPKEIIQHPHHLGLIENVFFCGRLSQKYGAIVLLEDDLFVSRSFYQYAQQTLRFYASDERVAGLSLNALWFNGYTHTPFIPLLDAADTFFMQVAWYQGQVYSAAQWSAFEAWLAQGTTADPTQMHPIFQHFPTDEWFPLKTRYLVETERYYVFPRQSLTTNFGDQGTHFEQATHFFQVPLQHFRETFRLESLDEATAVYDSFQELLPSRLNRLTSRLADYAYDVDLNGAKSLENLRHEYVLTTRACRESLFSFGREMRPLEANVIHNVSGDKIHFCRKSDLIMGRWAALKLRQSNRDYFFRMRPLGRKERLQIWLLKFLSE